MSEPVEGCAGCWLVAAGADKRLATYVTLAYFIERVKAIFGEAAKPDQLLHRLSRSHYIEKGGQYYYDINNAFLPLIRAA